MNRNYTSAHKNFMGLAFEKASQNLGSTNENPSVGCIIVKDGAVISSGVTSIKGRPHAEVNALNKNKNFYGSSMYVTLEPCVHYGKTSPCIKSILKKGIKKVYYPILDFDSRTRNKAKKILQKNKIKVKIGTLRKNAIDFYKSYSLFKSKKSLPLIDIKVAISKDYFSVNKNNKWITNQSSREKVHLLRSKYDCILSTYKTVNKDNSMLNCRVKGLEKRSPSRVIIDKNLKLKKKLKIFKTSKTIRTYIIADCINNNEKKFYKSKNVKLIQIKNQSGYFSFKDIFYKLKKLGFSRILCETGFCTSNLLIKKKLINNLYVFKTSNGIGPLGKNSYAKLFKNLKYKKKEKINVNLSGDQLYKYKIK